MLLVDIDDVLKDIPNVIAIKGDKYEYEKPADGNCAYHENGAPSCMLGYYLINNLKVPVEFFDKGDDGRNQKEFPNIMGALWRERGITFTKEAESFLTTLQELQDDGMAWGMALKFAIDPAYSPEDDDDEDFE